MNKPSILGLDKSKGYYLRPVLSNSRKKINVKKTPTNPDQKSNNIQENLLYKEFARIKNKSSLISFLADLAVQINNKREKETKLLEYFQTKIGSIDLGRKIETVIEKDLENLIDDIKKDIKNSDIKPNHNDEKDKSNAVKDGNIATIDKNSSQNFNYSNSFLSETRKDYETNNLTELIKLLNKLKLHDEAANTVKSIDKISSKYTKQFPLLKTIPQEQLNLLLSTINVETNYSENEISKDLANFNSALTSKSNNPSEYIEKFIEQGNMNKDKANIHQRIYAKQLADRIAKSSYSNAIDLIDLSMMSLFKGLKDTSKQLITQALKKEFYESRNSEGLDDLKILQKVYTDLQGKNFFSLKEQEMLANDLKSIYSEVQKMKMGYEHDQDYKNVKKLEKDLAQMFRFLSENDYFSNSFLNTKINPKANLESSLTEEPIKQFQILTDPLSLEFIRFKKGKETQVDIDLEGETEDIDHYGYEQGIGELLDNVLESIYSEYEEPVYFNELDGSDILNGYLVEILRDRKNNSLEYVSGMLNQAVKLANDPENRNDDPHLELPEDLYDIENDTFHVPLDFIFLLDIFSEDPEAFDYEKTIKESFIMFDQLQKSPNANPKEVPIIKKLIDQAISGKFDEGKNSISRINGAFQKLHIVGHHEMANYLLEEEIKATENFERPETFKRILNLVEIYKEAEKRGLINEANKNTNLENQKLFLKLMNIFQGKDSKEAIDDFLEKRFSVAKNLDDKSIQDFIHILIKLDSLGIKYRNELQSHLETKGVDKLLQASNSEQITYLKEIYDDKIKSQDQKFTSKVLKYLGAQFENFLNDKSFQNSDQIKVLEKNILNSISLVIGTEHENKLMNMIKDFQKSFPMKPQLLEQFIEMNLNILWHLNPNYEAPDNINQTIKEFTNHNQSQINSERDFIIPAFNQETKAKEHFQNFFLASQLRKIENERSQEWNYPEDKNYSLKEILLINAFRSYKIAQGLIKKPEADKGFDSYTIARKANLVLDNYGIEIDE